MWESLHGEGEFDKASLRKALKNRSRRGVESLRKAKL